MGFDFNFRMVESVRDRDRLSTFLHAQSLSYPNYADWVEKTRVELAQGDKRCIIAQSNGVLVGDCVYQQHRQFPRIREVKNMRVHEQVRGRHFATFMLRQAEVETPEEYDAMITDIRANQPGLVEMVRTMGYSELARIPLYETNMDEVVMIKTFERTPEGLYAPFKSHLFSIAS
ncbi:MAG: GNAT family N-acetyltransferase [Nanoarchaeota archaeon]|nr:GNAT family N-acetyltransferase [Nanoarchaeota archaeon]